MWRHSLSQDGELPVKATSVPFYVWIPKDLDCRGPSGVGGRKVLGSVHVGKGSRSKYPVEPIAPTQHALGGIPAWTSGATTQRRAGPIGNVIKVVERA